MSTTATKERPILFSGPMVRAILDGRKTQTRRIVKPQPPDVSDGFQIVPHYHEGEQTWHFVAEREDPGDHENPPALEEHLWKKLTCPYGSPGDRLWVRECIAPDRLWEPGEPLLEGEPIIYRASEETKPHEQQYVGRYRPSIHIPRWASRLTLEVTSVRVERLQDIKCYDIRAEGVDCPEHDIPGVMCVSECGFLRSAFIELWESIHGAVTVTKGCVPTTTCGPGWNEYVIEPAREANPWLWVVSFEVAKS